MAESNLSLTANFPRVMRGYSVEAVDDFVRQLGERITSLQQQLDEKSASHNRISGDLEATAKSLTSYIEKEQAIARGLVDVEHKRVEVERSLELETETARAEAAEVVSEAKREAEAILEQARAEAAGIVEESRMEADDLLTKANADLGAQDARLADLGTLQRQSVAQLRDLLHSQLNLLARFDNDAPGYAAVTAEGFNLAPAEEADVEEGEFVSA